ncbi:hypothetical protein E2C01_014528 [Portunus trituberculatus]|uniref:Uncharacterized protein n=1 Tax=Portunus trituberculatus TaxID=210409 RepID=A0A5B7DJF7_PORTR|nr:hypothetical protein [Portunus trituberculatus]
MYSLRTPYAASVLPPRPEYSYRTASVTIRGNFDKLDHPPLNPCCIRLVSVLTTPILVSYGKKSVLSPYRHVRTLYTAIRGIRALGFKGGLRAPAWRLSEVPLPCLSSQGSASTDGGPLGPRVPKGDPSGVPPVSVKETPVLMGGWGSGSTLAETPTHPPHIDSSVRRVSITFSPVDPYNEIRLSGLTHDHPKGQICHVGREYDTPDTVS